MKRLIAVFGLLFGMAAISHAGIPQETYFMGQGPLSNTTVQGSTWTATSPNVTLVSPTCTYGSSSYAGRICLTKEVVQLSTAAVFYALDAGTTVQYVQGFALSGSTTATGSNTLSLPRDHLGPICFGAGDSVQLSVVGTAVSTLNNVINWEGYTACGEVSNKGQVISELYQEASNA